jgi:hypothetical protein
MYANKRSVAKAQGAKGETKKNTMINKIRHRGAQHDHIQVTPDGKVIQHYKVDQRNAHVMKEFKELQAKAAEEEADKVEVIEAPAAEETSE